MSKSKLTIAALAWNEREHLPRLFASLRPLIRLTGASTLVLFDPAGDKATLEEARRLGDRVEISQFVNFSAQRNRALSTAGTEWVLFIDPDERMTRRLAKEIAEVIDSGRCAAYRVPRRNILFGREVRHTGWYPDYQDRLLRRELCRYDEGREVHEAPECQGETGTLHAPLIHFNYENWRQFYSKQMAYSELHARALYNAGHRARARSFVGQPLRELKRRFIDYQGYRDGVLGLALSLAMAAYTLVVYARLAKLQQRRGG